MPRDLKQLVDPARMRRVWEGAAPEARELERSTPPAPAPARQVLEELREALAEELPDHGLVFKEPLDRLRTLLASRYPLPDELAHAAVPELSPDGLPALHQDLQTALDDLEDLIDAMLLTEE